MKTLMLIGAGIVGIALSGATVLGGQAETKVKSPAVGHQVRRVILVEVTSSRIPQRVVMVGQHVVNSASPLSIIGSDGILNTGATTVSGVLSHDPDITFSRAGSH